MKRMKQKIYPIKTSPLITIFESAWALVKGVRLACFITFFSFLILSLASVELLSWAEKVPVPWPFVGLILALFLAAIIYAPALHSFARISLRRIQGKYVSWRDITHLNLATLKIAAALMLYILLIMVINRLVILGIAHLVNYVGVKVTGSPHFFLTHFNLLYYLLLGVYFALGVFEIIVFFFMPFFLYEGRANPLTVVWHVLRDIRPYRLSVLWLFFVLMVANIGGALLMGYGLTWTIPWTALVLGRYYHYRTQPSAQSGELPLQEHARPKIVK